MKCWLCGKEATLEIVEDITIVNNDGSESSVLNKSYYCDEHAPMALFKD